MRVSGVGYQDMSSDTVQFSPHQQASTGKVSGNGPVAQHPNNLAAYVTANAYGTPGAGGPVITAGPDYTFGPNDKPAYNPAIDQLGTDPNSDNGQVAANAILRMEQQGSFANGVADEAQFVTQALANHKGDQLFLQQYFGKLGVDRTAQIFRYLTSLGHVQTRETNGAPGLANADQLKSQFKDMAEALSTLVKSKDFNQKDMDRLVSQFAQDSPENNFTFAKDVLGQASPEVNQMFYDSAKNYALDNTGSAAGQAMAAYAMQALSQSSNPMTTLAQMPGNQLHGLVNAAMHGAARYGNPPSLEEFAKTGIYRPQDGQGEPLDGLSNLMFDAAYADVGDAFAPAPLSSDQAHGLQANLFGAAMDGLRSDSSVRSFYDQNPPMKDALAAEFESGYDAIVKSYSGPDGELTSGGMQAFETFFSNAVFTPPPSSSAAAVTSFFQNKVSSFISDANQVPANTPGSLEQRQLATSMGEQAQAEAVALKQSLASILNGSKQATQDTQNVINTLLTAGEAGVGAAGPAPAIGAAIVGESLKLLVASGSDSSVQNAIADLKSHGVDVSKYSSGDLQNESESISNYDLRLAFQNGLNNTNRVLGS